MAKSPDQLRESRWPAIARVSAFWGAYLAILLAASIPKGMLPVRWGQFAWGFVSSVALLLLTLAFLKRERRTPRDVGLQLGSGSLPRFLLGAIIGFATYALNVAVVATVTGGLQLRPVPSVDWSGVVLTLCTLLALSCMEELGFRGYPLRTLVPRVGLWAAQAIVAVAFALTHMVYGWSWNSVLFGVLPSAFLFGAAAIVSGGLAMPIGLHMAVNAARWSLGDHGGTGLFTMVVEESARGRVERLAPVTGVAITLLMAAALWWWQRRVRPPVSPLALQRTQDASVPSSSAPH